MEDVFDRLEESYNCLDEEIYIIKTIKNKKRQKRKIYYLETISQEGRVTWTPKIEEAISLFPINYSYQIIRDEIRSFNISCKILRVPKNMKPEIIGEDKPVRKVGWWDRIKVWFSRKVEEFCLPNESGDD